MSVGSFFHKIGHFFTSVFGTNDPRHLNQTIATTIRMAAPMAQGIAAIVEGEPEADKVEAIINEVQSDFAVVSTLVQTGEGVHNQETAAKVVSLLKGVQDSLTGMLSAGHIKNAELVGKVSAVTNMVTGEVEAMLTSIPQPQPAVTAAKATA